MSESLPTRPDTTHTWLLALGISLIAIFVCFWNLGIPSFDAGDESLHVMVTQNMLHTGDLRPRFGTDWYLSKPPLKMWLSLIPLKIAGESTQSYRFIDALSGVGTVVLTFFSATILFRSNLAGVIAALAMLGSWVFLFAHCVRQAVQDSFLVFLSTALLFLGARWMAQVHHQVRPARRELLLGAILIGAAVLTKHASGVLAATLLATSLAASGWFASNTKTRLCSMAGVLLGGFGFGALFYGPVFLLVPGAFQHVVGNEVVRRALKGFHNQSDTWLYFRTLFLKDGLSNPWVVSAGTIFGIAHFRAAHMRYLLVWSILPLALFSCMNSRLVWYITPTFPAFALLCGAMASHLIERWRALAPRILLAPTVCLVLVAAPLSVEVWKNISKVRALSGRIQMDQMQADLRNTADRLQTPLILATLNLRVPGFFERTYMHMISARRTLNARSFENTVALISARKANILITYAKHAAAFAQAVPPVSYRFLPPQPSLPLATARNDWLLAFSYLAETPPGFIAWEQPAEVTREEDNFVLALKSDAVLRARGLHIEVPEQIGCLDANNIPMIELTSVPNKYLISTQYLNGAIYFDIPGAMLTSERIKLRLKELKCTSRNALPVVLLVGARASSLGADPLPD